MKCCARSFPTVGQAGPANRPDVDAMEELDLRRSAEREEREQGLAELAEKRQRPFDLPWAVDAGEAAAVWRTRSMCWLVTMHHIVRDGWSLGIMVRELTSAV